ncbi:hypothetical protein [Flavobacterium johnsoniae]|uniref:Uncharacterized protein n=1 Tax=Flavobacterium johnsoniae TaxID=986 RepID=A0A1M5VIP3_FLAJO|nr:hypothetical protein [Flavobacterium johnsoniae]SHH75126.1 hypothetical protein SAMN05444388_1184 [Flavobacterium johnsoniae]
MENLLVKNENNEEAEKELVPVEVIRPFTDAEIDAHAAKCGGRRNLREISVLTDNNEEFVYLVKKPSRNVLQAIAEESNKGDKKNITVIQKFMLGCVLEGDKEAYEHDGSIYTDLLKQMSNLVKTKRSEIKKI